MWGNMGIFLCLNRGIIKVIILSRIRGNGFDKIDSLIPGFIIFRRMKDGSSEVETV